MYRGIQFISVRVGKLLPTKNDSEQSLVKTCFCQFKLKIARICNDKIKYNFFLFNLLSIFMERKKFYSHMNRKIIRKIP